MRLLEKKGPRTGQEAVRVLLKGLTHNLGIGSCHRHINDVATCTKQLVTTNTRQPTCQPLPG